MLDQQTEKLIAHTQKLMGSSYPLLVGQQGDLLRAQQEQAQQLQQYRPGAKYRTSYSGIHQKQYDRQRMLDFYSSIRLGDLDDQAKLRSQAIKLAPPLDPNKLRYSVTPGTHSRHIKLAMERRKDFWLETTSNDPHYHFKWQPWSGGLKFDVVGKEIAPEVHPCQKQVVNHFEGHACVSEKSKLFTNLSLYASNKLNENVFDFLPLTFFVECDLSKQKQYSKSMVQFMNAFYALDDIKKRTKKFYQKLDGEAGVHGAFNDGSAADRPHGASDQPAHGGDENVKEQLLDDNFIFKHFYQNKILLIRQHKKEEREEKEAYMEAMGTTALLQGPSKSIKRFDQVNQAQNSTKMSHPSNLKAHGDFLNHESCENINLADHHSSSANAPHSQQKQTQNKILKKYFFRQSMPFCHYSGHNLWILKATKLNQGQGIHVCNSLPQVKSLIQRYCEGFPKKQSENFTYERDVASNKKQQKSGDFNASSQAGAPAGPNNDADATAARPSGGAIAGYTSSDSRRASQTDDHGKSQIQRDKQHAHTVKVKASERGKTSDLRLSLLKPKKKGHAHHSIIESNSNEDEAREGGGLRTGVSPLRVDEEAHDYEDDGDDNGAEIEEYNR